MKASKRILSIVIALVIMVSVMVTAAVPSASAATNGATSFTSGKLVKAGNYYFSSVYVAQKERTYILRTNLNGTGTKAIGKGIIVSGVYSYNNVAYFSIDGKIYSHNAKTLKTAVVAKSKQHIRGICAAGLITSDDNVKPAIYLLSFKGKFKKIAASSTSYLAANNQYIFYTQVEKKFKQSGEYYETTRIVRYTIKTGATQKLSTFTADGAPYDSSYASCFDRHVFKNTIVFLYGYRAGSGGFYSGDAYKMKADGTGVMKLQEEVGPEITPGKGCVFVADCWGANGKTKLYRITDTGKISLYVKNTSVTYTTAGGYRLNSVSDKKSNYHLYLGTAGSSSNGKCVLNSKKCIKSSDPSDAYAVSEGRGAVGNVALVTVNVYTYQGAVGWRSRNLRTYVYLVNSRTGKLYRMV